MGDVDYEKAILGVAIRNYEPINLNLEDFTLTSNRTIFRAIQEIASEGGTPDMVGVYNRLQEKYKEAKITTQDLLELAEYPGNSSSLSTYIREVKRKGRLREINSISAELQLLPSIDNEGLFRYSERLIGLVDGSGDRFRITNDTIGELQSSLDSKKGKELFGYSFGKEFEFLDKATSGLQKGRTYRIGAPSNLGKSQLTYNFINNTIAQGANVVFFALENDREFTITNLMANYLGVSGKSIERGETPLNQEYLTMIKDKLTIIDGVYELSEIFSYIIEINPDVVFLDYIGLASIKRLAESELFTEYAKQVQRFVKRQKIVWVDLSNLPIGVNKDDMKALGQFFGSSYLRNNADVGIHMTNYDDVWKWKEYQKSLPNFQERLQNDKAYSDAYYNSKGINMMITKNRIGYAGVECDYIVRFDKGAKFSVATQEIKDKLVKLI